MYAQLNADGTYQRDLPDGNIEFSPRVFQPARTLSDEEKAEFRVVEITPTDPPSVTEHQSAERAGGELVNGAWRFKWTVRDWTADEIAAYEKAKVPASVTRRQGMAELIDRDLTAQIGEALDAIPGKAGMLARNDFLNSQEWQRTWPLIAMMAQNFGWSEQYVDQLFISAKAR